LGGTFGCAIRKLIISIWNKEELPEEWRESIIVPIYKKGINECNNYRGISLLPTTYKISPRSCSQGQFHMRKKLLGIINVDSDAIGGLLISYSAFVKYLRKNGTTMIQGISSL
jgi:hypothetical protein